jgi:S-phase kinase-associated protein 1
VNAEVMEMLLTYMQFHAVDGRSDKERRQFNERFVRADVRRLCELTSAADALRMRGVVDLASRQLARMIEGKSPEQIREIFSLPDDLTEEEKLEPIRGAWEDARIRLLNRLYAKKRQVGGLHCSAVAVRGVPGAARPPSLAALRKDAQRGASHPPRRRAQVLASEHAPLNPEQKPLSMLTLSCRS